MAPDLTTLALATGALGTAAFGVVEGLKWTPWIGLAGFDTLWDRLGPLTQALATAYGPAARDLIADRYRGDADELARLLRQGVRVGLTPANAADIARFLGSLDGAALRAVLEKRDAANAAPPDAATGQSPAPTVSTTERALLARYELAADARIEAALIIAKVHYTGWARGAATIAAILMAFAATAALRASENPPATGWVWALIIGFCAVPVAPIAKDLASGLSAATRALKARG
jgi:hypothetical protein